MNPKDARKNPTSTGTPAPRRRFRLQKLEDRIAPKKGGKGTNNCPEETSYYGGSDTGTSGY